MNLKISQTTVRRRCWQITSDSFETLQRTNVPLRTTLVLTVNFACKRQHETRMKRCESAKERKTKLCDVEQTFYFIVITCHQNQCYGLVWHYFCSENCPNRIFSEIALIYVNHILRNSRTRQTYSRLVERTKNCNRSVLEPSFLQ